MSVEVKFSLEKTANTFTLLGFLVFYVVAPIYGVCMLAPDEPHDSKWACMCWAGLYSLHVAFAGKTLELIDKGRLQKKTRKDTRTFSFTLAVLFDQNARFHRWVRAVFLGHPFLVFLTVWMCQINRVEDHLGIMIAICFAVIPYVATYMSVACMEAKEPNQINTRKK